MQRDRSLHHGADDSKVIDRPKSCGQPKRDHSKLTAGANHGWQDSPNGINFSGNTSSQMARDILAYGCHLSQYLAHFGLTTWRSLIELSGVVDLLPPCCRSSRACMAAERNAARTSITPKSATRLRHIIRLFVRPVEREVAS